jgi:glutathionylspermidine synthase
MSAVAREVSTARRDGARAGPLRAGPSVDPAQFSVIRRRLLLKHCKWDPQVADVSTLAPFPLLMGRDNWSELETMAERLTAELLAAEQELLRRDELHSALAIPRALRRILRSGRRNGVAPSAVRAMRFDFHWTKAGWQISEVNADVPGGFSEASELTRLMSTELPSTSIPGDPARLWAARICAAAEGRPIALLAAPGFMEDQQVVSYLAQVLRELGVDARLAGPLQLEWRSGCAHLNGNALGAVVRFYQVEWLPGLPRRSQWSCLLSGGRTPVTNPLECVFGESKRFPLVWDSLRSELPTWRRLLPETRDPRDAPWRNDESWLLKAAWCNTGDSVSARGLIPDDEWRRAFWSATLFPRQWIAQRRFDPVPVASPIGDVYPCIGVYTIDGRAAGAYSRISTTRFIDHRAIDAALLLAEENGGNEL